MELTVGKTLFGFLIKRERFIPEQEATLYELEHVKTGAELCYLASNLENKLFCAAFKTTPFDNTGVFHILEHSVLCGSELYPVREPFVELLKSSMQTFLNAMTFSDKTVYPCSSRNDKDFLNLTKVYLDAVFAPRCAQEEKIFMQEGWHWETDENGHRFKGVVYNEMKGAMAGADSILERGIMHLLFPNSCYHFNSGGEPSQIPDLTYETFVETYKRFYHPSNCRLYLDGAIPVEETLTLIDRYLSRFEKLDTLPEVTMQTPVSDRKELFYAINDGEEEKGKSFFTMARIFDGWEAKEKTTALMLLIEVLTDSNSSPLKKAILDAGLGEDVEVNLETGLAQSFITITVRNTDKDAEERIVETWDKTIRKLMEEGIDREEMEAGLASLEYRFREPSEPRALYRGITTLDSWLYGGDPALYLTYEEMLKSLHERLERDEYTVLLSELLSTAPGMCRMWVLPSQNKTELDLKEENDRLAAMAAAETEKEKVIRLGKNRSLFDWQNTPDTREQLETLPQLTLRDIPDELHKFPTESIMVNDVTALLHKTETNGVVYVNYYFKLSDIPIEDLPRLNFFASLITEIPTKMHPDLRDLQRQLKLLTGNVSFSLRTDAIDDDVEYCTPYFIVKFSTVSRNVQKACELINDLLLTSDLSDSESIRQVLLQEKEDVRQNIIMRGDSAAVTKALASCSARYAVTAAYSGHDYLRYLKHFTNEFETELIRFTKTVINVQRSSFVQKRMLFSLTAKEIPEPAYCLQGYQKGTPAPDTLTLTATANGNTAIKLPASIGFSAAAWYIGKDLPAPQGSLHVAAKVLGLNTLWNRIRVKGGAYGAGFSARRDNCIICSSFRDPTPLDSLNVYRELGEELAKWCDGEEKIDKYIISTVAEMEPLLGTSSLAAIADAHYLTGYTYEKRQAIRCEMLRTDKEQLRNWVETLNRFGSRMSTCLVGNETIVSEPGRTVIDL